MMTTNCDRNTPFSNNIDGVLRVNDTAYNSKPVDRVPNASAVYREIYSVDCTLQNSDFDKIDMKRAEYICNNTEPRDHYSESGLAKDIAINEVCKVEEGAGQGSALAVQVSGDHYKNAKIQPIEFIHANNIPFCEANVIKYIFRWKAKNGLKDLEKARHYIDLLIELESKNV